MEHLLALARENPGAALPKYKALYAQYPEVLAVGQGLSACLYRLGQKEEGRDLAEKIAAKDPEYLFGRIGMAQIYLNDFDLESAKRVLQPGKNLTQLCPKRSLFHISEIIGYHYALGKYFLLRGRFEDGEACLALLQELAPDDPATRDLEELHAVSEDISNATLAALDAFLEEIEFLAQNSEARPSRKAGSRSA